MVSPKILQLEYHDDDHENQEVSEWDQVASEQDQEAPERDKNDENVCGAGVARDQNDKIVSSAGMAWDQNDENVCGASTHQDEDTLQKEKQMTYQEALLGLDNSELGSDF